ncbi:MAG: diguanylate cyclase, partial [Sphingomonadales bacterium]
AKFVEVVQPLHCEALLADAADRLNADQHLSMLPVVDHLGKFKGAVYDRDVRQVLLSEHGRNLLADRGAPPRAIAYAKRCPVADVHATVDAIIESYVAADAACGLILLDAGVYAGYLSNSAVLKLAAERDILVARDQNPLTRLPGNQAIDRYIAARMASSEPVSFAIIDFDNFKAFNDRFGFAAGDRALQMFADALRELERRHEVFVGHIGGDDFFVGLPGDADDAHRRIADLCAKFAGDAASLYPLADRSARGISGQDRFGIARFFPLLRASGGVLTLPAGHGQVPRSTVERRLAELKAKAKRAPDSVVVGCVRETDVSQVSPGGPGIRLVG